MSKHAQHSIFLYDMTDENRIKFNDAAGSTWKTQKAIQ
jgi:hypothetical protein